MEHAGSTDRSLAALIENCAHPDFRPALKDYLRRAERGAPGRHTPHLIEESLSWHRNFLREGSMAVADEVARYRTA